MKKNTFLLCLLLLCMQPANAQLTKGNWLVGGNGSFSSTKFGSDAFPNYKSTNFSISPDFGYFIFDKMCAGLKISATLLKGDYPANPGSGSISYSNKSQFYGYGPFARYYFLEKEKMVNIFLEGIYQHQLRKDIAPGISSKQAANSFSIMAGPVIYLNSSVGIELGIGYSSLKYESIQGRNNTFQTSIGFQIHLDKKEF